MTRILVFDVAPSEPTRKFETYTREQIYEELKGKKYITIEDVKALLQSYIPATQTRQIHCTDGFNDEQIFTTYSNITNLAYLSPDKLNPLDVELLERHKFTRYELDYPHGRVRQRS